MTARAAWTPARRASIAVQSGAGGALPISRNVAERLFGANPGRLTVSLAHALPVGQGFGMSAAGAVATALAVAAVADVPRQRAIEVAHLADLFGGGGLGGVAAILGGGLEVRTAPGVPPFGRVTFGPGPAQLLVGVVGRPISTRQVLSSPRWQRRIAAAAAPFERLAARPTVDALWSASESFTDRLGLAPRRLGDVLRGLRRRGGRAAQAMFGTAFFAALPRDRRRSEVVRWLARRGIAAVEMATARRGAHRLPDRLRVP